MCTMKINKDSLKSAFSKETLTSRKFKHGGLAVIILIFFLVAVVIVNMIAGLLTDKYPFFSVDLTRDQTFNMTQESIDYVKGLDKDISITVLNDEDAFAGGNQYFVQANNIIKQYPQYNSRITLNYVNVNKNPAYLNSLTEDTKAALNDIIVECEGRQRVIASIDLFNTQQSANSTTGQMDTYIVSSKAEQTMTSALLYITSDNPVQISLLTGFGESEDMYQNLVSMLENNNFKIKVQNIMTEEEVDPESKIAVIFAPAIDYTEDATKKVEKFLNNDGNLGKSAVYFVNMEKPQTPNLDNLLKQWDIAVGDGMVAETNYNLVVGRNPYFAYNEYVDEEYTKTLKNVNLPTVVPFSYELMDLGGNRTEEGVKVLLQSSSSAAVSPSKPSTEWTPTKDDIVGNVPTVLVSTDATYVDDIDYVKGNFAVVGSYSAVIPGITQANTYNNSAYFVNMFNVLSERENAGITIQDKVVGAAELSITSGPANVIGVITIVIVPVAILVVGLVIWIRRRNR